jgi:hypothetical protein
MKFKDYLQESRKPYGVHMAASISYNKDGRMRHQKYVDGMANLDSFEDGINFINDLIKKWVMNDVDVNVKLGKSVEAGEFEVHKMGDEIEGRTTIGMPRHDGKGIKNVENILKSGVEKFLKTAFKNVKVEVECSTGEDDEGYNTEYTYYYFYFKASNKYETLK